MRRRPSPQTTTTTHIPAPVGGLNAVSPATAMPASDLANSSNLIPSERGLRVRLGFQTWCEGISGSADNTVRTVIPFTGSAANGAGDKLFAATATGLWDVTDSMAFPPLNREFANQSGLAGYGVSCVITTLAGRFLLYCDEVNGLFVYSEASDSWTQPASATTQAWTAGEFYVVGNSVVNGGNEYVCVMDGTSDVSGAGPSGTGSAIADGTTEWNYVATATTGAIGPSLADQVAGYTARPENFVFCAVWGSRLWLVERDTSRAYYLDVNSLYGTATSFDFGSKMQRGGPLVGLWSWSYDGGSGLDALLVGISQAGDVVVYRGSDPTDALTFGLKGSWFVGGVPAGRRIAIDAGGDLLVLSVLGLLPLSKLVVGAEEMDQTQYATAKIAPVFSRLMAQFAAYPGWALVVHPTDNALLVLVPSADASAPTTQLALSLSTKGWFPYSGMPVVSAAVWSREMYFGTEDGRVCRNTGWVDEVPLSADSYEPIDWKLLTSFQNLGSGRNKQIQMMRPLILSETANANVRCEARYDFNDVDLAESSEEGGGGSQAWDEALWDSATWGGDFSNTSPMSGATGMGRAVAVSMRGNSISRTTIVGVDVLLKQGGLL